MQKRLKGNNSERLARLWLESKGYQFVASNFTLRIGEIDLIMRTPDGCVIVFIEVRYRKNQQFGGGVASVDSRKQRKLRRTATAWLQKYSNNITPARIDVIALSPQSDQTPINQQWHGHQLIWVPSAVEA